MTEKYALIIIGIVALVGIMGLTNFDTVTGKFTETVYQDYCNPSACEDACGKICAEYRTTTLGKCPGSYILVNGQKIYRTWLCD